MVSRSPDHNRSGCATRGGRCPKPRLAFACCVPPVLAFVIALPLPARAGASEAGSPLPDVPLPQISEQPARQSGEKIPAKLNIPPESPCQIKRDASSILQAGVAGAVSPNPANPMLSPNLEASPCQPLTPLIDWYARFLNGPQVKPLTPKEKGWLAIRNLIDPFNLATIAGNSAIVVGSNSHSPYGPGMAGFARNVGVSFTQDMTAEFVTTFAIPSVVHEDPHYHRMPTASIERRFAHAIIQVVWTQGDNGKGMVNYSDLVGFAIDGEIANTYVPGQQTDLPATARRYATGLATAPIDNFITEVLPTIASRLHTRVVFVQNIINQVARSETVGQ